MAAIYAFNTTINNSNDYTRRNSAMQALFNNLVSNSPTGWSVIASTIPTPSSTAYLVYEITLEKAGFRLRLYTGGNSSALSYLYGDIKSTNGTTIVSGSTQIGTFYASIGTMGTISLNIDEYYTQDTYQVWYIYNTINTSNAVLAKLFLTSKTVAAPDFLFNASWASNLMDINGNAYTYAITYNLTYDADGKQLIGDYHVRQASTPYRYCGKIINAKHLINVIGGTFYQIGTDIYIGLASNNPYIIIKIA